MGKETREAKQGKAKNGKQSQQTYSEQERNACSKEQDHAKKGDGKTKNPQIGNKDNAKQTKTSLQKKIKIKKKRQNKTRNENEAKQNEVEKYKRKANEFNTLAWQSKES